MPSEYSNLNFHNRADFKRWKKQCEEQRRIAQKWPAYNPRMGNVEEYGWRLGPWSVRLTLEIWRKPYVWHCSAAIFEQVALETVVFDNGPMAGAKVEVPQDALLMMSSWHYEHYEQARYIMGEALGPELKPGDNHQPAMEFRGNCALHWLVKYEGPETWRNAQH